MLHVPFVQMRHAKCFSGSARAPAVCVNCTTVMDQIGRSVPRARGLKAWFLDGGAVFASVLETLEGIT